MKIEELEQTVSGKPGKKTHYVLNQDEAMNVVVRISNQNGLEQFPERYLGKCGDIGNIEIQGAILERLYWM